MNLKPIFADTRSNGDHVDYFRDERGRCVVIVNARLRLPDGVVAAPTPEYDYVEIDGVRARGAMDDELTPKIMKFLHTLKWEQSVPSSRGLIALGSSR